MTVIFVRHGESEGNLRGIIQGQLDQPLTAAGRAQALAAATRFRSLRPAAIYASDLARAYDTAVSIAAPHDCTVTVIEDLRERHYGAAQGLTGPEVNKRWPARASHTGDWVRDVPGAEPLHLLRRRAVQVVETLLDRHDGETVIAVSHGGTLAQIVAHLLGLPDGSVPRIHMYNTAVTVVEGSSARPVIRTLNDTCHLDAAGLQEVVS